MDVALLHSIPVPNMLMHLATSGLTLVLVLTAGVTWVRARRHHDVGVWMAVTAGALLLLGAEYADIYTPALGTGIGFQQYVVHLGTFLAFSAFFVGWHMLFTSRIDDTSMSEDQGQIT